MALLEEFEKQGRGLSKYGKGIPFTVLMIAYILLLKGERYPASFYFQETFAEELYEDLCVILSLVGFAIYSYSLGAATVPPLKRTKGRATDSYQQTGIYSVVRHPKYIGMVTMWMGPALITGFLWFEIAYWLFCWLYYERIMAAEETNTRSLLSPIYRNVADKTPAFIPNILLFKKPQFPFDWRKAVLREDNQLTYVTVAFFIFDFSSEMIDEKPELNRFIILVLSLTILLNIAITGYKRIGRASSKKKAGS